MCVFFSLDSPLCKGLLYTLHVLPPNPGLATLSKTDRAWGAPLPTCFYAEGNAAALRVNGLKVGFFLPFPWGGGEREEGLFALVFHLNCSQDPPANSLQAPNLSFLNSPEGPSGDLILGSSFDIPFPC